jgi:hypothetical protein
MFMVKSFLQGTDVELEATFLHRIRAGPHTANKILIFFVSVLAIVSFRTVFLSVLDMDGRGHHILLTSALVAITSCAAVCKTMRTQTVLTHFIR